MKKRIYIVTVILALMTGNGCHIETGKASLAQPIQINRFDRELFRLIDLDTPELQEKMKNDYPAMLKVIGLGIFDVQDTQQADFFDRLINYYNEPALNKLYRDAIKMYDHIETVEAGLGTGFLFLKTCFPTMQIPAVYMHVSGLRQNVLVDDSLLSISIDKYLGSDYPLYQDYFYDYQLRKMTPDCIVPDYLKAWLLSEYPFTGNNRVLLERMIYEGKVLYIIHRTLPKMLPELLLGYDSGAYQWCKRNEKHIWKTIIERKHLFTPDAATTAAYFSERPSDFISDDAPGNLGSWIGWQIVTKYMERTKSTIEDLMINNDYQDILTRSRYKP